METPTLRTCQMHAIVRETDVDAKMSPPHMYVQNIRGRFVVEFQRGYLALG